MLRQHTLAGEADIAGTGLHSGEAVRLRLRPAPVDCGVIFRRVDLVPAVCVPARAGYVVDTCLSTTLARDGQRVGTVEHLLAALSALGVDNAYVDISAAEVPIMDGSAAPFVQLIRTVGRKPQRAPRRLLRILRTVSVRDGDKVAGFLPGDGFRVAFSIAFPGAGAHGDSARVAMDVSPRSFVDRVSRARTFGFARDVAGLRARGMALGGSLDNALLLDGSRVLNPGGLRFADELVQHKVLDAIGDLSLLGHSLLGEYRAHKSGHSLNNAAVRALLARPDAWELVLAEGDESRAPGEQGGYGEAADGRDRDPRGAGHCTGALSGP